MLGVAWPAIRTALDAPLAGVGVLLGAMTVAQFAASTFSGRVRERIGTFLVLFVPAVLAALGLALFAIASDWLVVTVASALLGTGVGLLDAAVNTEAALRQGIRFMGALHGAWAVGAALGPPLIAFAVLGPGSWRFGYAVAAIAFLVIALAAVGLRAQLGRAPVAIVTSRPASASKSPAAMVAALMFVYVGVELGAGQWSFTRFTATSSPLDTSTAASAVFLYWSGLGAGRFVLAVVGHRLAPARWLDASVTGALLSTAAVSVAPPELGALVALPLLGLSLSVFVPVLIYVTPERVGRVAAPHVIGYMTAAGMLGGATLPAATGVLMQNAGVEYLGPALVTLSAVLATLHRVSARA